MRASTDDFQSLTALLFRRYPDYEWATFAWFGWRNTSSGLVLTLARLNEAQAGELDESVGHVMIREPYTLRVALEAETNALATGVIHSHPRQSLPAPSHIDDDMDLYYAKYFDDFAPRRPYVSLIVSEIDGEFALSGRVHFLGQWHRVDRFSIPGIKSWTWPTEEPIRKAQATERHKRFSSAFGTDAEEKLRRSTVAVIGAGGTGSAAIEVLARAGVGQLILVDPDHLEYSNLERVHGSTPDDAHQHALKVDVARRHVHSIDPSIRVQAIAGGLPHPVVVDAVTHADVLVGCTDQQHSRLALSDVARRYLIPALDCGVILEGREGRVSGQIIQIVRFLPKDPCPLCRDMIAPSRLAQELMSAEELKQRQMAANEARRRGEDGRAYWHDMPQLITVGYLTTTAGAMVASYVIGWITGRFSSPFTRLQMNLVGQFLDVTDVDAPAKADCACRQARGWSDQGLGHALITSPPHWTAKVV